MVAIDGICVLSGFIVFEIYSILFILPLTAESMEYSLPRIRGMANFGKVFILMEKEELCSFGNLYSVYSLLPELE